VELIDDRGFLDQDYEGPPAELEKLYRALDWKWAIAPCEPRG